MCRHVSLSLSLGRSVGCVVGSLRGWGEGISVCVRGGVQRGFFFGTAGTVVCAVPAYNFFPLTITLRAVLARLSSEQAGLEQNGRAPK